MISVPEELFDLEKAYCPFAAMGEIDDMGYLPKGDACVALGAALGRLAETRDDVFAFEDTDSGLLAVCGLKVKDGESIPVPLTEKYAKLLLDKYTKSDVGEKRWELAGVGEPYVELSSRGVPLSCGGGVGLRLHGTRRGTGEACGV